MTAKTQGATEPHGATPDKKPMTPSKREPESGEGDAPKETSPKAPGDSKKTI